MTEKAGLCGPDGSAKRKKTLEEIRKINGNKESLPLAYCVVYGCQQNEADMENIRGMLAEAGYAFTDNPSNADCIVVNTCAVREGAETRVFGNVGAFKQIKEARPELVICICGCMMQQEKVVNKIKKSFYYVDIVFGTHNIEKFPELLLKKLKGQKRVFEIEQESERIAEDMPVLRDRENMAKVTIMYGCNNFCSYCIVPYTRGRERSRDEEKILHEIKLLAQQGYKEVTLLGQNVNSYGNDRGEKNAFAVLLSKINKIDGIERIRFMSSHPKDFSDETIAAIAECEHVCKHIHLAMQSGSSRILKLMNRKYDKESFLALMEKIKTSIPGVSLTTDIIVGFPGETDEDFEETVEVLEKVRFDSIFSFIYSPREGTPAANMEDNVSKEEKQKHFDRLLEVQNRITHEKALECLGHTFTVLTEGRSKENGEYLTGHTDGFKLVHFKGDDSLIGKMVKVKIVIARTWYLMGELEEGENNE
ncbi:MAG: tRNA (N6-isopentenyl adenosine(37)-C2)-methylthiotransferase MiaB [Bacillota bacterium]|nr:tRNA (N6-isopentenyl adenosine(37)-C2)-methylthiotransferase MiaB [Bacillota bacterium]